MFTPCVYFFTLKDEIAAGGCNEKDLKTFRGHVLLPAREYQEHNGLLDLAVYNSKIVKCEAWLCYELHYRV